MISGKQHIRYGDIAPYGRLGVLMVFQQRTLAGVGLFDNGIRVAHEARHKAGNGLQHHRNRYFAAVEHIIANGILAHIDALRTVVVGNARVVPLVPAAAEQQMLGMTEFRGVALSEQRGRRVREDEHWCA